MKSHNIPEYIESITVRDFFERFAEPLLLRLVTSPKTLSRSTIRERSINRPALAVTGYYKYFANKRIQLFGAGEMGYLREQNSKHRKEILETIQIIFYLVDLVQVVVAHPKNFARAQDGQSHPYLKPKILAKCPLHQIHKEVTQIYGPEI